MAKKHDDSPNGMICRVCGQDKEPYHFFNPRNKFNADFFVNAPDGHTCFECGGDYKCITCGVVQPAAAYRVQGRVCSDCKNAARNSFSRTKTRVSRKSRTLTPDAEIDALLEIESWT